MDPFQIHPYSLFPLIRHPESRAAHSACQARPKQTCICGRPLSSVAQEDVCTLLSAQSRPYPPWGAGTARMSLVGSFYGSWPIKDIAALQSFLVFFSFKWITIWPVFNCIICLFFFFIFVWRNSKFCPLIHKLQYKSFPTEAQIITWRTVLYCHVTQRIMNNAHLIYRQHCHIHN